MSSAQGDWQRDLLRDIGGTGPGTAAGGPSQESAAALPQEQPQQGQQQGQQHRQGPPQSGPDPERPGAPAAMPTAGPASVQEAPAPQPRPNRQQQGPKPQQQGPQPQEQGPHPTPVSVPVVAPELAAAQGPLRHGDSFTTRARRLLRRLVSSTAEDATAVTEAARAVQQPITTGRQTAVTSIRGGSGKSTVTALLALTYAHYRADPVLALEADPSLGTLPRRLGATEIRWSCGDLARIVDPSMQITDLTGYLVPYSGGWLLPGSQGAVGAQLSVDTYRTVMTSMQRYFGTTVVDCETMPAEVARTAMSTTHARVLVAPATVEGVAATRSVLDWLGGLHRSMLPTTVVVLNHTAPDSTLDLRKAAGQLERGGAEVVVLPYDRHLAAGGAVRTDLLAQATRESATRLAAAVMDRAVSRERRNRTQQPGQRQHEQDPPGHPLPDHAPDHVPGHLSGQQPGGLPGPGPGQQQLHRDVHQHQPQPRQPWGRS